MLVLLHAQALSSSQAYIYEERGRLLELQAENDELRLQEAEDRTRIEQLLALLDARKPGGAAAATTAAAEADVLKMRVESLQAQLTEQASWCHRPMCAALPCGCPILAVISRSDARFGRRNC
jgi:coiled-coil domain-containing protein 77